VIDSEPEEDFVTAQPPVTNVIQFPGVRPNRKLTDAWKARVEAGNQKTTTKLKLPSPIDVMDEVMRQRSMPAMSWPAAWPNLARRMRTYPGDMVGVVGSQGGGKTSFAIQVAVANAGDGIPTVWMAGELDAAQITTRIVANMHGVHAMAVRDHWPRERIEYALAHVSDMFHFVDRFRDREKQLDAIRRAVSYTWELYRIPPLLVVDHIGKLAGLSGDLRVGTLEALELLRELTVEMQCYTMPLSQGSRGSQAMLTGKTTPESATEAIGLAAESKSYEDDCANVIALALFKVDNAMRLDAHGMVGKARHTGEEGTEGMAFSKPGGQWFELDYLPATPGEVTAEVAKAKKDKHRAGAPPELPQARADLNAARSGNADAARRIALLEAIRRHGAMGMETKHVKDVRGVGRGTAPQQALQDLERQGLIERINNRWRATPREE